MIQNEPGFFLLLFELFSAGRRNPEIQHEVGELFERTRAHVAEILKAKEREGVLNLRYDAEAIVSYLFAVGDGFALQALSDPSREVDSALAAGVASARYLLVTEWSALLGGPSCANCGGPAWSDRTHRPRPPVRKTGQPANA